MFRAPRITRYTLEAVLDIACHGHERPVQSKDITERHGIPRRYLEQVMQELVRAGLLLGIRGPRGGYRLARPATEITVGDIARVIGRISDGNEQAEARRTGAPLTCPTIDPLLDEIRRTINARLDGVTIASLCPVPEPAPPET